MCRFLIDECLPEKVGEAVRGWTPRTRLAITFVSVGSRRDLPKSTTDPDLLLWGEANDHILVTVDYKSMPTHLANHLATGHNSPGVLSVRPGTSVPDLIEDLVMIAFAGHPTDYRDIITYIPL